ncbi:hypothetical protein [Chryseolinea lacunae]|uniref:Uncharacterized protein n=1 Tax=Chryseolinea lacunae TaxID=2801331 RepID=A0ABS1L0P6_9BACT|nr:hypothetical protein [Chryseolinea lacunae]MBL0745219.1 hypothetical protein [Chryseolinea lacunae]
MSHYLLETGEFGITDHGIHLLRSGFNYKTIRWSQINAMRFEKRKELYNWWIILLIGTILVGVGTYLSFRTFDILANKEHAERYVKMMLFLLIPCVGIYFIYNSLRTGIVVNITYASSKKEMFPLRKLISENRLTEFKSFATEKLGAKVTL